MASEAPNLRFGSANPSTGTACVTCGNTVTRQFARVFGDNSDTVHACPACNTFRTMDEAAADAGGVQ